MTNWRKYITITVAVFLFVLLSCCGVKTPQQEEQHGTDVPVPADNCDNLRNGPYISITYGCNNSSNYTGRDMVFYSYDLTTKQLVKEATIPFDAKYATGVVSKSTNTIFFSRRSEPENIASNDSICSYDISTGSTTVLETENFSYNEIALIDPDTLLVMAVTEQHPIMPARFDLGKRAFTYMADANKEPFSLYTNGDSLLNYDYNTESFVSIFQSEEERYSPDYCNFKSEIGTYIAIVKKNLVKAPSKIFKIDMKLGHFIDDAVQISENELLVERTDDYFDDEKEELVSERSFYLLTFEDTGNITFVQTDAPFPLEGVRRHGYRTPDGGKTWYLILGEKSSDTGGLYAYSTETKEMTPILLNDPTVEGYTINFSFVGPQQ